MPEETPPSTDGGQASTSGLPQAGTPTTDGQAPVSQQASTDHERVIAELRKENAATRQRLKKFEDDEAQRTQAQLTEQEKLQQAHDALQTANEDLAAELLEYRVNQDISKLAGKFNFTLSADLLAKLLNWKEIEWNEENGTPTNIEKLLEKLAKDAPELVKQGQQQSGTPALPAMNPGRSSITQPGGTMPGRIPRLDDIPWKR